MFVHFQNEFETAGAGLNFQDNRIVIFFWLFFFGVKIQLVNWSMTKKWWQGPRLYIWNQRKLDRLVRGEI